MDCKGKAVVSSLRLIVLRFGDESTGRTSLQLPKSEIKK